MTALEALRWYENKAIEPSDETILAQHERFSVVESRPEPLEMTGDEIVDFLDEYMDMVQQIPASQYSLRRFVIDIEGIDTVRAGSLREAVKLAAAKLKEANS